MNKIAPWLFVGVIVLGSVFGILYLVNMQASGGNVGTPLSVPVSATDWHTGSTTAKVTLVEYGDFQCPACAAYFKLVKQLETDFPNDLALVFRNYPLPQHPNARPAAHAAAAAGKQGKFWQMFDSLYANQSAWVNESDPTSVFMAYAQSLGLNSAQFSADLTASDIETKISADMASGDSSGVQGTPTFFVNGKKIASPQSYDEFKSIIQAALAE
jgi:protein-disulfide isomerase